MLGTHDVGERGNRLRVTDVEHMAGDADAVCGAARGFLESGLVHVRKGQMTAAPRQRMRDRAADPAGRAGDDCGAAFQLHGVRHASAPVGLSFHPMIPFARGNDKCPTRRT
jgi:hypothetical protein